MPVPLATLTERHTPGIGTQCRPQPTPITVRGHHPEWVTAIQSIPNKGNSAREEFLLRPVQQCLMSQRLVIPVSGDAAQHAAHSPPLSLLCPFLQRPGWPAWKAEHNAQT